MGVKLTVKLTKVPDFSRWKSQFAREVAEEMYEAVKDAKEEIVHETLRGVDYQGKAFVPYSKGYAKSKAKDTKFSLLRPNLWRTGHMIESLQVRVTRRGSKVIGILAPAGSGEALKVVWNMRLRKFFAISETVRKDYQERMTNVFGRLK